MICPACGRKPAHTIEEYHYRESGLDNVFVRGVGIYKCNCGQEYVQLPGVQAVHQQVAVELLNKTSLLTGAEARFLRKWLGLTSDQLANALGYTRVSVSRRENKGLTVATDRSLRLYASQVGNIPIDVEKLFSTISDTPDQNFKITVGAVPPVPEYSVKVSETALAIASAESSTQYANLTKVFAMSQELAGGIGKPSSSAANQELAQAA